MSLCLFDLSQKNWKIKGEAVLSHENWSRSFYTGEANKNGLLYLGSSGMTDIRSGGDEPIHKDGEDF